VIVRQADRAFVTLKKGLHREVKPHSLIKKMYMHFLHIYVSPNIAGVIEYGTLQCLPANRQEDFIRKEKKGQKISGVKNAEVQAYLASSGRFLIKDKEEPAASCWTLPFS
jgi:hypothetical protein